MRNKFTKFIAGVLLAVLVFGMTACGSIEGLDKYYKKNKIGTTVSHHLYEYNVNTNVTGKEVKDLVIKAHERYKLIFDVEFDKNDLDSLGSSGLNTKITIKMGDYENEDNKNHLTTQTQVDGGYEFTDKGKGVWEASLTLKSTSETIPLEKTYFIVGIDSLGNGSSLINYQPVSIEFTSASKVFDINGTSKESLTLIPTKNDYVWSESNLAINIGHGAVKNNVEITIPKSCSEIKVVFWKDDTKYQKYGTKNLTETECEAGKITIVLSDLLIEYVGQAKWDEATADDGTFDIYVEYIAIGGKNFNDASFGVSYKLD